MKKILLGLIGLLFAVPAVATDLPAGYTELEYIESTGTQWIDTGVVPSIDMRWELDNEFTGIGNFGQGGSYNGLYDAKNPVLRFDIALTSSALFLDYGNVNRIDIDAQSILNHRMIFKIDAKNMQWAYGGNTGTLPAYTDTASTRTKPIYLFARNDSSGVDRQCLQKTYSSKIYKNEALVQELIPAKNSSGVVGMYDTVNNEFYTNQGTGEFIAGPEVGIRIATTAYNSARFSPVVTELNDTIATIRSVVTNTINQTKAIADLQATKQTRPNENCPAGKKCLLVEDDAGQPHWYEIIENAYGLPSGYTGLEYLQSDGASYLIVPYRVNNKTVFYCRYNEIQNGPQIATAVFGVTTSPDVSKANNGILRLTGSSYNRMGWGNSVEGSMINVDAPKEFNTWYEVLYDQNKLYQNDRLYATSATQTNVSWVAEYDLGVFARNSASVTFPAIAKISSVWAKENGEYKINLIPARRNSDNVIGMYDTVSGEFFTNKGSGTFTAGPEVQ